MKLPRPPKGFTLIELLVVISIIAVLASLAVPAVTGALVKGQLIQAVNNARQIHLATSSMANDATANSDPSIGWPGDVANMSKTSDFVNILASYDYLKPGDMKVFAAAGITPYTTGTVSGTSGLSPAFTAANSAFLVYTVSDNDASNVIFLTSKNYDFTSPSTAPDTSKKPFGDKGFVVCRKGGDCSVYKKQQLMTSTGIAAMGSATSGTSSLKVLADN